jgi:hypothetical protein
LRRPSLLILGSKPHSPIQFSPGAQTTVHIVAHLGFRLAEHCPSVQNIAGGSKAFLILQAGDAEVFFSLFSGFLRGLNIGEGNLEVQPALFDLQANCIFDLLQL